MLTRIKSWLGQVGRVCGIHRTKDLQAINMVNQVNRENGDAIILHRSEHNISRKNISNNALKVLYRLNAAGYQAYLVGGGVRDLLLGKQPKDFDVATDALPEEIKKLFRNCRLIGRRFRLAHVYFHQEIIEVSTFRAANDGEHKTQAGMLLRDNVYGSIDQDAVRRDFTVNAIYYNIKDFSLVDYVGGIEDIKKQQLKIIGDAEVRYREDPVRMLRAIRFASKLNLKLHKSTIAPLLNLAWLIKNVSPARLFEEYIKLFLFGNAQNTFLQLVEYGLCGEIFPQVMACLHDTTAAEFIKLALIDTDNRIAAKKSVSPAFLLAVFLWYPFLKSIKSLPTYAEGLFAKNNRDAMVHVLALQKQIITIPKNFVYAIKDVWLLQFRLAKLSASNVVKCYKSPAFRMAYDFLLLRAQVADEEVGSLARWWQSYVEGHDSVRHDMLKKLAKIKHKKKSSGKSK